MYAFTVLVLLFSSWLFVMLILMYAFIVLVLFWGGDCQADFDVDNVQRRELVNV